MSKKISVIIPVYNGAQYIGRCIESVLNQSDFDSNDIELLLINDGSKDDSLSLLRSYESKNKNVIKVVDQKNSGVAKTRNKGIKIAQGKYVVFIDQDDFIDSDFCNVLYGAIDREKLDVVVAGYRRPNEKGEVLRTVSQPNTEYSKKYKISAAWAKIHRTDFLKKNKIEFYDNNYGEDIIFTMNENNSTDRIIGIDYVGYNWFWNSKSVSNTSQRGLREDIKIRELIVDMIPCVRNDIDVYYVLQTGVHYLLFSGRSASVSSFMKLYSSIFAIYKEQGIDYKKNRHVIFGPKGALISVRVAVSGFILLHRLNLVVFFARIYCNDKK